MMRLCAFLFALAICGKAHGAMPLKEGRYFFVAKAIQCPADKSRFCLIYSPGSQSERIWFLADSKWNKAIISTQGKLKLAFEAKINGLYAQPLTAPKTYRPNPARIGDDSSERIRSLGP